MAKFRDLEAIKAAQHADAEAAHWALRGRGFWHLLHLWTRRLTRVAAWVKQLGLIVLGVGTIAGALYRFVQFRKVGPAEQPATGIASTAVDRVEQPSPPPQSPSQKR